MLKLKNYLFNPNIFLIFAPTKINKKTMKRTYYIVSLTNGDKFMVYTNKQLPYKMIMSKLYALGYDEDEIVSINQTNLAALVIKYRKNTINIDEVYDENQGECYQD